MYTLMAHCEETLESVGCPFTEWSGGRYTWFVLVAPSLLLQKSVTSEYAGSRVRKFGNEFLLTFS
jgi:hypothetical protein